MLNSLVGIIASSGGAAGGGAYESIASATGSGSAISFTSIPSTYQHLQLRVMYRRNSPVSSTNGLLYFNSDSATNYSQHYLTGDGATASAGGLASRNELSSYNTITGNNQASGIYGVEIWDIQNYASTTQNKTVRVFGGYDANGSGQVSLSSGVWLSTSAINRIDFVWGAATGSVVSLYGIKGA